MALSTTQLQFFRNELTTRMNSLRAEIEKATNEMLEDDATYTDSVDQASAETERSLHVHMKNRDRGTVAQLRDALRRIEEGTFGLCVQCDELISESRLRAFPMTTLCIDCKQEIEAEENRFSNRGFHH